MKNLWSFLIFSMILGYHTEWARAARVEQVTETLVAAADPSDTTTFTDSFGPELYSGSDACSQYESGVCQSGCVDRLSAMHNPGARLMSVTCDINSDGAVHCGCTFSQVGVGPYHPPCYWNCGSGGGMPVDVY